MDEVTTVEVAKMVSSILGETPTDKKGRKIKGSSDSYVISSVEGGLAFRPPRKSFLETAAGTALVVGVITAGLIVLVAGIYYLIDTGGAMEAIPD